MAHSAESRPSRRASSRGAPSSSAVSGRQCAARNAHVLWKIGPSAARLPAPYACARTVSVAHGHRCLALALARLQAGPVAGRRHPARLGRRHTQKAQSPAPCDSARSAASERRAPAPAPPASSSPAAGTTRPGPAQQLQSHPQHVALTCYCTAALTARSEARMAPAGQPQPAARIDHSTAGCTARPEPV